MLAPSDPSTTPSALGMPISPAQKVFERQALVQLRASLPGPVVFTNGVFDLLHPGHVSYLHAARALGGCLIVAINTDASARGLGKGPMRPLNTELDRAFVLAGLASVDCVSFFEEHTPVALIEQLRPDIYVKGGDYDMETLAETHLVRSWGGRSLALPFQTGYSTTGLVRRIEAGRA